MKKILAVLALSAAFASGAMAQVTISGSVEGGLRSSVADVKSVGGTKSDRNQITFSGREDLGNGLTASFTLQSRIDIANGGSAQVNSMSGNTQLFEQSALGLSSKTLGSVRVGRFTNALGANGVRYWLMEDSPYGAQDTTQYSRLSGQIEYTSPTVAGFNYTLTKADAAANKFITFVSGNGTTTTTDISSSTNDLTAHTVSYTNGPLFVSYSDVKGFDNEGSKRLGAAYRVNSNIRIAAGQFQQNETWRTQLPHKNNYVGAEYSVGKWVTAVTYSKASGKAAATHLGEVEKIGAKAYYSLSKRTTLQAEIGETKNAAAASNGTAYFLGMRHTF